METALDWEMGGGGDTLHDSDGLSRDMPARQSSWEDRRTANTPLIHASSLSYIYIPVNVRVFLFLSYMLCSDSFHVASSRFEFDKLLQSSCGVSSFWCDK